MRNLGSRERPVATICHNEDDHTDPHHRRVAIWTEGDRIMAQAPDDDEPVDAGDGYRCRDEDDARQTIYDLWGRYAGWDLAMPAADQFRGICTCAGRGECYACLDPDPDLEVATRAGRAAVSEIRHRGDHAGMLARIAASHALAVLREQGR